MEDILPFTTASGGSNPISKFSCKKTRTVMKQVSSTTSLYVPIIKLYIYLISPNFGQCSTCEVYSKVIGIGRESVARIRTFYSYKVINM